MSIYLKQSMRRQRGFVLAVSMIFLVVMTLLAVSAIKRSTLDEKITSNLRTQNLSFQAAEKALRFCERYLDLAAGSTTICTPKDVSKVIEDTDGQDEAPTNWKNMNIWKTGGTSLQIAYGGPDAIAGLDAASQPRCLIEEWKLNPAIGNNKQPAWIITARAGPKVEATGSERGENAVVWLQEIIRCGNM
ncbi:pilus assembly PilX family protein [Undibacterium sp. Di24W]|uniref:pilus assembly PilX family protein n=1 Tax=Undibacterium sp. Di24W TaxID=3413033 RepID=UPI003BF1D890